MIPFWKRLFVILDYLQILNTDHHRSSKSSKWQLMLIETRSCWRIVFGDIFFCDVAFAILLSAIVQLSSRKSVQYVTKTLTWALPPGGTSQPKCQRPTCHPRHWSLHDGHVLQVSFQIGSNFKDQDIGHKSQFSNPKVQFHPSEPYLWLLERREWKTAAGLLQEEGDCGRVPWLLGSCWARNHLIKFIYFVILITFWVKSRQRKC